MELWERNMENNVHLHDFLPLALFAWGPRFFGLASGDWEYAFYFGACAAIIQLLYSWYRGYSLDYIALGANAFMIYGALAYAIHPALLLPYTVLKQAVIFAWVFVVGLITTLVTTEGFIQGSGSNNLTGSIVLLGCTALALIVSYSILTLTTAGTGLGTILPFVGLLAGRAALKRSLEATAKAS